MGTAQQLLLHGSTSVGTLVLELLMESYNPTAAGGNPAFYNTAPGAAVTTPNYAGLVSGVATQSTTQVHGGTYSAHMQAANIATDSVAGLTIGTRGFKIGGWFWFNSPIVAGGFGTGLVQFATAGRTPVIYIEPSNGYLYYDNQSGGANLINTTTSPSLTTWHEIYAERIDGTTVTTLYLDGVALGFATDTSNYVPGTTLRIGSFGNTAAPMPDAYVDDFFFYNAGP